MMAISEEERKEFYEIGNKIVIGKNEKRETYWVEDAEEREQNEIFYETRARNIREREESLEKERLIKIARDEEEWEKEIQAAKRMRETPPTAWENNKEWEKLSSSSEEQKEETIPKKNKKTIQSIIINYINESLRKVNFGKLRELCNWLIDDEDTDKPLAVAAAELKHSMIDIEDAEEALLIDFDKWEDYGKNKARNGADIDEETIRGCIDLEELRKQKGENYQTFIWNTFGKNMINGQDAVINNKLRIYSDLIEIEEVKTLAKAYAYKVSEVMNFKSELICEFKRNKNLKMDEPMPMKYLDQFRKKHPGAILTKIIERYENYRIKDILERIYDATKTREKNLAEDIIQRIYKKRSDDHINEERSEERANTTLLTEGI